MSEFSPEDGTPLDVDSGPQQTGDARVDEVLASLDALDGLPVDDHVAVFERAHEELRRALDAAPATPPSSDA